MIKRWYQKIISLDAEVNKLLHFVEKFAQRNARVLDVGCGYGRYLVPLKKKGFDVLGVDKNPKIIKENVEKGINCISLETFSEATSTFDIIICSHIIEHFCPEELLTFLNFYLSRLEKGGYLIIATPLYSDYFYDDFDHVKPYHPLGLQMVFGQQQAQVQYYSTHKLEMKDIWFRKSPFISTFHRAKLFKSAMTRALQMYDLLMCLLYWGSFRLIGRKDGWVGVFQKC